MAEWKPIETAPRDGTPILATDGKLRCIVRAANAWVWAASKSGSGQMVFDRPPHEGNAVSGGDEIGLGELTHWMPLPEPPK